MDILPPKKSQSAPQQVPEPTQTATNAPVQPKQPPGLAIMPVKRLRRRWPWFVAGLLTLIVLIAGAAFAWYQLQLQPANSGDKQHYQVTVEPGMTVVDIAAKLSQQKLIKDERAFRLYASLSGTKEKLQAGSYRFSPSQTTQQIIDDLVRGKTSAYMMTIPPGKTLREIKQIMTKSGFKAEAVDAAFKARYPESKVFAAKPADATLEGYIFPETYQVDGNTSAEQIIAGSLRLFDKYVAEQDIEAKLARENLSLHQGIILASIVAQETANTAEQKQVSQVFLKRLKNDMELGSDVTFVYAAKQLGVAPSPDLDSPYNTRIVKGLPPGPVGNFNADALLAVAEPSPGDYLYFVSGDDGVTRFSYTLPEHEEKTRQFCQKLCQIY